MMSRPFSLTSPLTTRLKYLIDLALWLFAVPLAFALRLDVDWLQYIRQILTYGLLGLCVKGFLLYALGLHRQHWRKIGVLDLYALLQTVGLGIAVLFPIVLLFQPYLDVPRSIPLIEGGLALIMLGGVRLFLRLFHERGARKVANGRTRRVLVVGAGETGTLIAREMLRRPEWGLTPVGFLDDEPEKRRESFLGLPVFGAIHDLPQVTRQANIGEVLIAMPSAAGKVVRHVVELSRQAGVDYRIFPGVYEILSGKVSISQIRKVDLEDLLRREPIKLNHQGLTGYLADRVILITGAGGSIGSEIVRQIASFNPRKVILLDHDENSLFHLERELERAYPALDCCLMVADIQRHEKIDHIFETCRPQVVFHAAAHKHVPMMESNPDEAILNNIQGTKNLLDSALKYQVERFVNISTDKAVRPASVMGASKRVAEYLVECAGKRSQPGQVFVSVRFGNVLGSQGSVVPLFKEQILAGGPVTVTHPDMTRYFMTIPEAVQLVLQAGGLGENGVVYVLDMGEPVKILDMARDLIRLSGLKPDEDIEIVFTGPRRGEKLVEEILAEEDVIMPSQHEKILVARPNSFPGDRFETLLEELLAAAYARDNKHIREVLKELVPSYTPPSVLDDTPDP